MFDLFRRKSKTKAIGTTAESLRDSPPPSYQSTNPRTTTVKKAKLAPPVLHTGCPCHLRYHALKSSIEEIYASYLALPAKIREQNHTTWALGRIKALLGIVRTPASPCAEKCECHSEYKILKTRLESDKKDVSVMRKQTEGRSLVQIGIYERFFGEVQYLHGMLRDCVVRS